MKKIKLLLFFISACSFASMAQDVDTTSTPKVITLEQALQIALSENTSVKVADMEIERTGYARKGSYSALFPQVNASGMFQRTLKKQVMYMDFDMGALGGGGAAGGAAGGGSGSGSGSGSSEQGGVATAAASPMDGGIEVGRWNTYNAGISASMPLVSAQLWQSLKISDQDVEIAVEKARSSRLDMVNQVKQAYFSCLLARELFSVYESVYDNAVENLKRTQSKYNAQKASELDLTRAKTAVANAVPNLYNAESSMILSLWQLKAVMGVDLDENIDVAGELSDYAEHMLYDFNETDGLSLENNSTLRQLGLQAEQLAAAIKMQQYAYLPTLAVNFSYSMNAMTNDFKFSQYKWTPHSYVGVSLSIPIFSGGQRYHAIKQSQVQARELELQTKETERQLKIGIRQSLNQMETAIKTYDSARSALETAQKAYDIAEKSYAVGRNTLTDLNDAQLALTQAQLAVSQAVYNFVSAKATLESTLGADFIDEEGNVQLNKTYNNE